MDESAIKSLLGAIILIERAINGFFCAIIALYRAIIVPKQENNFSS
jgi:hypothetical protein